MKRIITLAAVISLIATMMAGTNDKPIRIRYLKGHLAPWGVDCICDGKGDLVCAIGGYTSVEPEELPGYIGTYGEYYYFHAQADSIGTLNNYDGGSSTIQIPVSELDSIFPSKGSE